MDAYSGEGRLPSGKKKHNNNGTAQEEPPEIAQLVAVSQFTGLPTFFGDGFSGRDINDGITTT